MDELLGKTLPIKKEHLRALESIRRLIDTASLAQAEALQRTQSANDMLWVLLDEVYPETKDYRLTIHWDTNEISVLRKKSKWEIKAEEERKKKILGGD